VTRAEKTPQEWYVELGGRSVGDRWEIGGKDDAMWKTIGKWWFNGILWWFTRFNSGFYHSKW